MAPSLLDVVKQADNTTPLTLAGHTPFFLASTSTQPIGYVPPSVLAACLPKTEIFQVLPSSSSNNTDGKPAGLAFVDTLSTPTTRTAALAAFAEELRAAKTFPDPLDGWRDEKYTIYGPPEECLPSDEAQKARATFGRNVAFSLERAVCGLFGVTSFGVHLTGFVPPSAANPFLRMWTPRRAMTKQTFPGLLDQTVAGGLTHGLTPLSCVIKECAEEASIPKEIVLAPGKLTAAGAISYVTQVSGGWVQPEMQFVYDLELPESEVFTPKPCDGEAENFELLDVPTVLSLLHDGSFKPNCALVMIDFLIRRGIVTAESEPDFLDILRRLHRDLGLPGLQGWGSE